MTLPLRNRAWSGLSVKEVSAPGEARGGNKQVPGKHWPPRPPVTMATPPTGLCRQRLPPFKGCDCGVFSAQRQAGSRAQAEAPLFVVRPPRRDHQAPRAGTGGAGLAVEGKGAFRGAEKRPFSTPEVEEIRAVGGQELNSKSSLDFGAAGGAFKMQWVGPRPEHRESTAAPSSPGDSAARPSLRASPTGTCSSWSCRPPLAHPPALRSETPLPFVTFYAQKPSTGLISRLIKSKPSLASRNSLFWLPSHHSPMLFSISVSLA